ncbi:MAG: hypothetical protein BWK78_07475 [Thiotrichaceae bacterium IS1]|nr:MAG: hypothetical protein BWK78_07475 [Thiotrichaceae bacterium IS1]
MTTLETIDARGQIMLSKQYAGRQVSMAEIEPGVWIIKLGEWIPKNERWLWEAETKAKLDRAIAWAEEHPPEETDLDLLAQR